ncbi:CDP-diacylglycerol--glycerol-3-phosphate 3-phosphatidyltransferase-like protein, partial [Dinothrombium tinctorium]
ELTSKSKQRIVLSSLYIGTNKMEKELMLSIKKTMEQQSNLKLTVLVDYMRGNRLNDSKDTTSSTKALLQPLINERSELAFYLSPLYAKWWRKYFLFRRQKLNEIISVQHIKCFIFDNNLVISGANLSQNYFTNRQDRYFCFYNCKEVCDYFEDLIKLVSTFSLQLTKNGDYNLDSSWPYHPMNNKTTNLFMNAAYKRINDFQQKYSHRVTELNQPKTVLIPLVQMKTFNINDDEIFTTQLLKNAPPSSSIKLTTGYFNLTKEYMKIILNRKTKNFDILMASERANGFYGAKGVMNNIPSAYTHLARKFLRRVESNKVNINLWSYFRENWTFHAKGLWINYEPGFMLTTIGSPNFGYRSVNRDLEAQVALITEDEELKSRLKNEYERLWNFSQRVETENELPTVKLWVTFVTDFVKHFF